jgi:hypothetical protein
MKSAMIVGADLDPDFQQLLVLKDCFESLLMTNFLAFYIKYMIATMV